MSAINPGIASPQFAAGVGVAAIPNGAIIVSSASGNVANASAVATLAAAANKFTYIQGCFFAPGGATAGLLVNATIVGLFGGTFTIAQGAPAGVLVMGPVTVINFGAGYPSSAVNTAIVVTLPALGSGNTNASVGAWGYQL